MTVDVKNTLSVYEAMHLYDALAEKIFYGHAVTTNCCERRAHMMCVMLQQQGLQPSKIWAFEGAEFDEDDKRPLSAKLPDGQEVLWWYHVAPVVAVQHDNGDIENYVFDPALFDGPVTCADWAKTIDAQPHQIAVAPYQQGIPGRAGWYIPLPPMCRRHRIGEDKLRQMIKEPSPEIDARSYVDARQSVAEKLSEYISTGLPNRVVFASDLRKKAEASGYSVARRGRGWISAELYAQNPRLRQRGFTALQVTFAAIVLGAEGRRLVRELETCIKNKAVSHSKKGQQP